MKSIYKLGLLCLSLMSLSACEKLEDINENKNQASSTHPKLQLTKIEWETFRANRGTAPLYAIRMLVQTDGENSGQLYNWQRGSFSEYNDLRNIQKMEEEASKGQMSEYIALAKFFKAYNFYNLTLRFGDIPFSEAIKGETDAIYKPKYDTQKDVFLGILKELEQANDILKTNNNLIDGDIIFKGDMNKWRRAINAFRLKVLISLSKHEQDSELKVKESFSAIAEQEPLLLAEGTDAQLVFLDQQGNRYPEFNSSSYGSGMYMDSTFIQRFQALKDPRLFVLATQTRLAKEAGKALDDFSSYEGGDPIKPYAQVNDKAIAGRLSKVAERFHSDPVNEPFVLIGYAEQQLILAEAAVRGWTTADAANLYKQGIIASFKFYENYARGASNLVNSAQAEIYSNQSSVRLDQVSSMEAKLERIITQKYLRSFHQNAWSSYMDYLRTGYPNFRKLPHTATAYRWMYPQLEYNMNAAHVSEALKRQFNGVDRIQEIPWWVK